MKDIKNEIFTQKQIYIKIGQTVYIITYILRNTR